LNKKSTKLKNFILSDYKFYLSELMMHKVDRTSMDNSLEIRSPFLDHKLIEYVISTNMDFFEIKNPKSLLKEFLSGDFDESFLNRQKMGFVFDLESWVYSNGDLIKDILKTSEVLKRKTIKKLFRKKSRINSIRILKLLTLTIFINDYKNISSEKNI
jgi:asparagine synthase (glutamine-hydrolysing)